MTKIDIDKLTYRPCVGLMVLNRDGLIWLGRRSDAKSKIENGTWWQIDITGATGWVANEVVQASDTKTVPVVSAPPTP